jgi:hypothetical protein
MTRTTTLALTIAFCLLAAGRLAAEEDGMHLFILSGQSNMAGLNPDLSFTPTVKEEFGDDHVIVVKSAQGGQPIRRWYKAWKSADGIAPKSTGDLYDKLMGLVNPAIEGKQIKSITFVWMQGERDAKEKHSSVYAASFAGLVEQLRTDMKRKDINFVIGRLSDYGDYPDWTAVREAQVQVAKDDPRGAWVDTDDLNGPNDGLHYNREGYVELGSRFAKSAIALINGEKGE